MRWIEDAVQKGRDHKAGYGTLLPLSMVRGSIDQQMKEAAKLREELKKKENGKLFYRDYYCTTVSVALELPLPFLDMEDQLPPSGYLRVIPTYRTGLTRGTSVKLYIESSTTTDEVITLVVKQVAKATNTTATDFSDYYLVASLGTKDWILPPPYRPLQLQADCAAVAQMGRVFLSLKKRSEENQLNQLVTSV